MNNKTCFDIEMLIRRNQFLWLCGIVKTRFGLWTLYFLNIVYFHLEWLYGFILNTQVFSKLILMLIQICFGVVKVWYRRTW